MSEVKSVCVYCGANSGNAPVFVQQAEALGREIASAGLRLVYGGGSVGLMGTIADAVLQNGGAVTGIIPKFLADREVMHKGVTDLVITADMHERKRLMFEKSDSFVALPGGIGTLEELVEMLTWAQLGRHKKPVLIANFDGYWQSLLEMMDMMRRSGFLPGGNGVAYLEAKAVQDVVPALQAAARAAAGHEGDEGVISRM